MKRDKKHFQTGDLYEAFKAQGFNQRTHHAFDHGVEAAVLGKGLIYRGSASDYADAELFGYSVAQKRLSKGHRWQCAACGHIHGVEVKP